MKTGIPMLIATANTLTSGDKCVFEVEANVDLTVITMRFGDMRVNFNYDYLASNMEACEELRHILDIIRQDVEVG